jgi:hypothetical protein
MMMHYCCSVHWRCPVYDGACAVVVLAYSRNSSAACAAAVVLCVAFEHGLSGGEVADRTTVGVCPASALSPSCLSTTGPADLVNIAVVVAFDAAVIYTCGFKSIVYLLAGTVFGGGLHPMAGHLISEHYMFVKVRPSSASASCCAVHNIWPWNLQLQL